MPYLARWAQTVRILEVFYCHKHHHSFQLLCIAQLARETLTDSLVYTKHLFMSHVLLIPFDKLYEIHTCKI